MKLEVGQKIGIYQATKECWNPHIRIGDCYLMQPAGDDLIVIGIKEGGAWLFNYEVRKVGSLIVKRIK